MNIVYQKNKLKKQLSSASEIKKSFGELAKRISQRLQEFEASQNLSILMQIPAANCHRLLGDRKDEWAVDVSGNFRIIFMLGHEPVPVKENGDIDTLLITNILITEIEDYH